jgi:hypothetical protein
LFITNVIKGIQPITKYRKKDFDVVLSKFLLKIKIIVLLFNLNVDFQVHWTKLVIASQFNDLFFPKVGA